MCWCQNDLDSNPLILCVSLGKLLTISELALADMLWGKQYLPRDGGTIKCRTICVACCWTLNSYEISCHYPLLASLPWSPQFIQFPAVVHFVCCHDSRVPPPLRPRTPGHFYQPQWLTMRCDAPFRGAGRGGEKMGKHSPHFLNEHTKYKWFWRTSLRGNYGNSCTSRVFLKI